MYSIKLNSKQQFPNYLVLEKYVIACKPEKEAAFIHSFREISVPQCWLGVQSDVNYEYDDTWK